MCRLNNNKTLHNKVCVYTISIIELSVIAAAWCCILNQITWWTHEQCLPSSSPRPSGLCIRLCFGWENRRKYLLSLSSVILNLVNIVWLLLTTMLFSYIKNFTYLILYSPQNKIGWLDIKCYIHIVYVSMFL